MLKENNVNIFLIGESLMKKPDVTSATKEILGVKN
jgi:indole-3-glycerol phosphate synthase